MSDRPGPERLTSHAEYAMPYVDGAYHLKESPMITTAQIEGLVRAALAIMAGYALKYGIDDATWAVISASLLGLATAGWSLYSKTQAEMLKTLAKDPEVTQIEVDSAKLANSIPSEKVVAQ
jgi:hypothetical protein